MASVFKHSTTKQSLDGILPMQTQPSEPSPPKQQLIPVISDVTPPSALPYKYQSRLLFYERLAHSPAATKRVQRSIRGAAERSRLTTQLFADELAEKLHDADLQARDI